jgi:hypothetical protein
MRVPEVGCAEKETARGCLRKKVKERVENEELGACPDGFVGSKKGMVMDWLREMKW